MMRILEWILVIVTVISAVVMYQLHIDNLQQMQTLLAGLLLTPEHDIHNYIEAFRINKEEGNS